MYRTKQTAGANAMRVVTCGGRILGFIIGAWLWVDGERDCFRSVALVGAACVLGAVVLICALMGLAVRKGSLSRRVSRESEESRSTQSQTQPDLSSSPEGGHVPVYL